MAIDVTETELKYEIPEGVSLPRLDSLPRVASTSVEDDQLDAEYYDSSDLRLIRAGITLRRRSGGDDAGWHLKLPAGADTRTEIRLPLGRSGGRVPAELAGLVRAHVRGEGLRPVVRMSTATDKALHEARKAAKRARYAGEAVTAAFGTEAGKFIRRMKKIQSVLGDHQDTVIARRVMRELGISAHLASENAFSYGLVYGQDACDARQLRARASQTWDGASRSRYRRWLR